MFPWPHRTAAAAAAAPAPPRSCPFCWGGSSSASEHSSGRDAGAGRREPCEGLKLRQAVPQYQRETSPSFLCYIIIYAVEVGHRGVHLWSTGSRGMRITESSRPAWSTQGVPGSQDYPDCIVKDTDLRLLSFHRTVSLHIKYPACDIIY